MSLSEQQEKFCQNIVKGMSQTDAYKNAGYKCSNDETAWACASRLLGNAKVALRVEELRAETVAETKYSLAWLLDEAAGILADARNDGSHSAAIAAIKEIGILSGERVEKRQNQNINRNADEFSADELAAIIESGGSAGAAKPQDGQEKPRQLH